MSDVLVNVLQRKAGNYGNLNMTFLGIRYLIFLYYATIFSGPRANLAQTTNVHGTNLPNMSQSRLANTYICNKLHAHRIHVWYIHLPTFGGFLS